MRMEERKLDERKLREVALTRDEYRVIVEKLRRPPNDIELGMLGVLWSEHCSYKTSKALLRRLPSSGAAVLQGPGENAGAVSLGNGWAVVFKIESHSHPSAIEPYQGAATGVGGILRDVIAMGARPIALLDSLRFGPLPESRRHFDGVVAGIGGYGNCIGVPTVGGEVYFEDCYAQNPVVNAMCVGLVRASDLMRARAEGTGNKLLLVGADTGRDGIHGAECAGRVPGAGAKIDVSRVPRRERGMTPYDVMLSESQERMLVVVRRGREADIERIFETWDLTSAVIGEVTDDGHLTVVDHKEQVARLPIQLLTEGAPLRRLVGLPPESAPALDLDALPPPADIGAALLRMLASPNRCSRWPIIR